MVNRVHGHGRLGCQCGIIERGSLTGHAAHATFGVRGFSETVKRRVLCTLYVSYHKNDTFTARHLIAVNG
jgi:hypothetical protein